MKTPWRRVYTRAHMASIHKEIRLAASAKDVWDAVRDIGNIHKRVCPGFLTDCRMDGPDARVVTFANGMVVKELIIDVDDETRRVAWAAEGGRTTHYNASMQIFPEGEGCRAVWIADLLPNDMAGPIAGMIDQGLAAMKRRLDRRAA
jgi:carbon monoxide dehydrogenase subunit G